MTTAKRRAPSERGGAGCHGTLVGKVPATTFISPEMDLVPKPARGVNSFEQQGAFFDGLLAA
jgi:hypothetical protein